MCEEEVVLKTTAELRALLGFNPEERAGSGAVENCPEIQDLWAGEGPEHLRTAFQAWQEAWASLYDAQEARHEAQQEAREAACWAIELSLAG